MKKFSIVLLALLLAGGFAFAATIDWTVSGDASSGVKFDLDNDYYGMFYGFNGDLDGTISDSAEGEGDLYGTISVAFFGKQNESTDGIADVGATGPAVIGFESLSAAIHSGDVKISFGSAASVGPWKNGARGYSSIDLDGDGGQEQAGVTTGFDANAGNLGQGVAVTVDKITVGGVYVSDASVVDYSLYGSFSDSYDGLDVDLTAGFANEDLFGGAKVATEVEGWSVFAASDFSVVGTDFGMDATVGVDGEVEGLSLGAEVFVDPNISDAEDLIVSALATMGLDLNEDLSLSGRVYTDDITDAARTLGVSVGLTNATMIDGATLNLDYSNSDLLASNLGTVSAYANVAL